MTWISLVWGGPFKTPPVQQPITVGWVLLKLLETIWRLFLVVAIVVALAIGGAWLWQNAVNFVEEARERSKTKAIVSIAQRAQQCADRQINPGPGANRIRVTVEFEVGRSGELTSAPKVIRESGVDAGNAKYLSIVADQAVDSVAKCAPYGGLPDSFFAGADTREVSISYRLAD